MEPRRGRLVRPLLSVTREDTRAYCVEAGLDWREDESNADRRLARNLLRLDVLPLLREDPPGAERNVLATAAELRDEAEVLDAAVDEALRRTGAGGAPAGRRRRAAGGGAARRCGGWSCAGSRRRPPARPSRCAPEDAREIERLAARGGSGSVDLGGGVRAAVEYGLVRFGGGPRRRGPGSGRAAGPGHGAASATGRSTLHARPAPGGAGLGSPDEPRARRGPAGAAR